MYIVIYQKMTINDLKYPFYLLEESRLRSNLRLIKSVADRAQVEIILAFKAYSLWRTFPIIKEYIQHSTASSVYEAQLAVEEMKSKAHTFSPAYTYDNIDDFINLSSHITFNSISQYNFFRDKVLNNTNEVSWGLRINPEYSPVETELYNPCIEGSRFGVVSEDLVEGLPDGIEGLHFHVLCEGNSYDLEKVLDIVEQKFPKALSEAKWLNMGGGHLMTHKDYNVKHLIKVLKNFKSRHPHLKLILEPGSAFTWQCGSLYSKVVDIVCHKGIKTAILDVSFTCHMPDCIEMPYQPEVRGAKRKKDSSDDTKYIYRLGGNSCLSGDWVGDWIFPKELAVGDIIVLEDMLHYTNVKTTMFNGIHHPSIAILHNDNTVEILREYSYDDYKTRMD